MTRLYIANLIIDFKIKDITVENNIGDSVEIDPITGNPLTQDPITGNPVTSQTLYRVGVHIKGLPNILQQAGSNPNIVGIVGRVTKTWNNIEEKWEYNKKIIPQGILRFQMEANAIYIEPDDGTEQPCHFTLEPDIDSQRPRVAKRLSKRLGSPIKGTLKF